MEKYMTYPVIRNNSFRKFLCSFAGVVGFFLFTGCVEYLFIEESAKGVAYAVCGGILLLGLLFTIVKFLRNGAEDEEKASRYVKIILGATFGLSVIAMTFSGYSAMPLIDVTAGAEGTRFMIMANILAASSCLFVLTFLWDVLVQENERKAKKSHF
jgi:phosphotransferase system  glucose/maltose/N-acetylglucosamine-specific IIC component